MNHLALSLISSVFISATTLLASPLDEGLSGLYRHPRDGWEVAINDQRMIRTNFAVSSHRSPVRFPSRLRSVTETRYETTGYYEVFDMDRNYLCDAPVKIDIEYFEAENLISTELQIPAGILQVGARCIATGWDLYNFEMIKVEEENYDR